MSLVYCQIIERKNIKNRQIYQVLYRSYPKFSIKYIKIILQQRIMTTSQKIADTFRFDQQRKYFLGNRNKAVIF